MEKKDEKRLEKRLAEMEAQSRDLELKRMKVRLRVLADIVVVVGAIVAFLEILFHNPGLNYLFVLIPTCAVTGLFLYRAFSNGEKASVLKRDIWKLDQEAYNIECKLGRKKPIAGASSGKEKDD